MALDNPITIHLGKQTPLGPSIWENKIHFAIVSSSPQIELVLFEINHSVPFLHITLNEELHKSQGVWSIALEGLPVDFDYSWKIGSLFLCDPYSKALSSPTRWKDAANTRENYTRSRYLTERPFDWKNTKSPRIPLNALIIYEMHIHAFTEHPSSKVKTHGTYLGLVEKIPHLLELGINAVELLPVYEFDERGNSALDPLTGDPLCDYWGYNPLHFFCPMKRYAADTLPNGFIHDFKTLVRSLHAANIAVILDVVYNHTGEGCDKGKTFSFKGLNPYDYYLFNEKKEYSNYSGTGNTLSCNEEPTLSLIVDSMRYWITEFHIDGFRFDLASILTRGKNGEPLEDPPLLRAIKEDPICKEVYLIMEPWDAGGLYQLGKFPKWGPFLEWNGRFRDIVRRFLKGTDGQASAFATSLCGSQDLYHASPLGPLHSINFITCHDGFSLHDLVSYQEKHNARNGENNNDGASQNDSWNCGVEGATQEPAILSLRERQMRNHILALILSLGIPMLLMGDEYGHTRNGNNNPWCQDNVLNWFNWKLLENERTGLFRFFQKLIALRKQFPLLHQHTFFQEGDIQWHGIEPNLPDWSETSRLICFSKTLGPDIKMLVAFHSGYREITITLPSPTEGKSWYRLIDTAKKAPNDFLDPSVILRDQMSYTIDPYTAILLISKDCCC